jgi:hypothetical protein
MKLQDCVGTTHVEGVHFTGELIECFSLIAKDCSVRIQNCRSEFISNRGTSEHPDLIQVQAGARNLYVDGFTGTSSLQGFVMRDNAYLWAGANMDDVILKRVNLIGRPGHLMFRHDHITIPTVLEDFWLLMEGNPGRDPYWSVYPNAPNNWIDPDNPDGSNTFAREVKWGDAAHTWLHWPDPRENLVGRINIGTPPGGDFVTAAIAGVNYVSPGYN